MATATACSYHQGPSVPVSNKTNWKGNVCHSGWPAGCPLGFSYTFPALPLTCAILVAIFFLSFFLFFFSDQLLDQGICWVNPWRGCPWKSYRVWLMENVEKLGNKWTIDRESACVISEVLSAGSQVFPPVLEYISGEYDELFLSGINLVRKITHRKGVRAVGKRMWNLWSRCLACWQDRRAWWATYKSMGSQELDMTQQLNHHHQLDEKPSAKERQRQRSLPRNTEIHRGPTNEMCEVWKLQGTRHVLWRWLYSWEMAARATELSNNYWIN